MLYRSSVLLTPPRKMLDPRTSSATEYAPNKIRLQDMKLVTLSRKMQDMICTKLLSLIRNLILSRPFEQEQVEYLNVI